jgi:hypothetical protein
MFQATCGFVATAAILLMGGCGASTSGPERLAVSGEITLDGKLLESGRIRFIPADPKGIAGFAGVSAGQYAIPKEEGLPAGDYRVEIEGDADLGFPIDDDVAFSRRAAKPVPSPVPVRFSRGSKLTATVTEDEPNEISFPLDTKDTPSK